MRVEKLRVIAGRSLCQLVFSKIRVSVADPDLRVRRLEDNNLGVMLCSEIHCEAVEVGRHLLFLGSRAAKIEFSFSDRILDPDNCMRGSILTREQGDGLAGAHPAQAFAHHQALPVTQSRRFGGDDQLNSAWQ